MSRPRLVFMGTPAFAVPSLLACLDVGDVLAVITQPDKPQGRGNVVVSPPVKQEAQARGIPVWQPFRWKGTDMAAQLQALEVDAAVVTAYGRILPPDALAAPRLGCVNVHASLLPRFRGAAPIQWAIAAGDTETGVCLMQMEEGLDTGPVIDCRRVSISPDDTTVTLGERLSQLGGQILRESLPKYLQGELTSVPQPSEGVVLAPLIDKEEGRLDFRRSALELERRHRAFSPWPGTFSTLDGKRVKVLKLQVVAGSGPPGQVLSAAPQGVEVACGDGALRFLEVQPEGRRAMPMAEFLASRTIAVGSSPFGG